MSNGLRSSKDEALNLLSDTIKNFTSPNRDIKSVLRNCQHVCELLGWDDSKRWFHQEINGYNQDSDLPDYRKISGIKKWDVSERDFTRVYWLSEISVYGIDSKIIEEEPDYLEMTAGIDWIITSSQKGYIEQLPETKIAMTPHSHAKVTLTRIRVFSASTIAASLSRLENALFDFLSRAYVELKYSNVMESIWRDYQSQVDKKLSQLNLAQHYSAIEANLLSTNPEGWRLASFGCRDLLTDLANFLWQDSRKEYVHLDGSKGKLDVSQGNYINRLCAYIHQKGISGTKGKFLRDEAERLSISIRSLVEFQSEAHNPITLQNARSVAIATYILIGEIVTRTDLVPIVEYGDPAIMDKDNSGQNASN